MSDPLYRVRQLLRAANAQPLTEQEIKRVETVLTPDALALYQTMPLGDQRHSLVIFDALREQGYNDRPLLQAALLHDVAKRNIGLAHRTGVVMLNKWSSDALARWASSEPHSWRYPFYVSLHHPELGAELAAHTGVEPEALELIREHQAAVPNFAGTNKATLEKWHHALKALDDVN